MAALALRPPAPLMIRLGNGQLVPASGTLAQQAPAPIAAAMADGATSADAANIAAALPTDNVVQLNAGAGGAARAPALDMTPPQAQAAADPTAGAPDIGKLLQSIAAGAAEPPSAAPPAAAKPGLYDHLKDFFLGGSSTPAPAPTAAAAPAATGALPAAEPGFFDKLQANPLALALLTGGLSTMSAASRPGATPLGALGEGALGGVNAVFTQAAARHQAAADDAKAASEAALRDAQTGVARAQGAAIPLTAAADVRHTDADTALASANAAAVPGKTASDISLQHAQAASAAASAAESYARAAAIPLQTARGRWSPPSPGTGTDPKTGAAVNGSYTTNLDTGDVVFHPGVVLTGKAGGGSTSATQYKHDAWLAAHPGDEQGALDYAGGHRTMTSADANRSAYNIATQELRGMAIPPANTSEWLDKRAKEISGKLTAPAPAPQPPPKPVTAAGGALAGLPAPKDRVVGKTTFTGRDGRKFVWSANGWLPQ